MIERPAGREGGREAAGSSADGSSWICAHTGIWNTCRLAAIALPWFIYIYMCVCVFFQKNKEHWHWHRLCFLFRMSEFNG